MFRGPIVIKGVASTIPEEIPNGLKVSAPSSDFSIPSMIVRDLVHVSIA